MKHWAMRLVLDSLTFKNINKFLLRCYSPVHTLSCLPIWKVVAIVFKGSELREGFRAHIGSYFITFKKIIKKLSLFKVSNEWPGISISHCEHIWYKLDFREKWKWTAVPIRHAILGKCMLCSSWFYVYDRFSVNICLVNQESIKNNF